MGLNVIGHRARQHDGARIIHAGLAHEKFIANGTTGLTRIAKRSVIADPANAPPGIPGDAIREAAPPTLARTRRCLLDARHH